MPPKQHGKDLIVEWLPDGGTAPADVLSIATKSRNFQVRQQGNSQDTSVREDIAAGASDSVAGAPTRNATLSGLDPAEDDPDWESLEIDDTGTLTWYRRGKTTGMPLKTAPARVSSSEFGSPHDNANTWSLEWQLTGPITTDTVE